MTTIATITRKLNIRFIDARILETSAKLNLGITGYPNDRQADELIEEVLRLFYCELSIDERNTMQTNYQIALSSNIPKTTSRVDDNYDEKSSSTRSTTESSIASPSSSTKTISSNKVMEYRTGKKISSSTSSIAASSSKRGVKSASTSIERQVLDDHLALPSVIPQKKKGKVQRFLLNR